jgi:peptidase E
VDASVFVSVLIASFTCFLEPQETNIAIIKTMKESKRNIEKNLVKDDFILAVVR